MSFFRWFSKKGSNPESTPSLNSDLGQVDETLPILRPTSAAHAPDKTADGSSRKSERLERRELLYGIVRECMTGAGVLSSAYKFKVLSLDAGGRKYLVMMDLPREHLVDPAHFSEIEGSIARGAKERFEILVTAVYWRINEMVTAVQRPQPQQASALPTHDSSPVAAGPAPYAPLQAEELMAFKRAVSAAASGAAAAKRGEPVRSARRNPEHAQDFSNTEPFDASSPLGTSQFGGLG